MTQDFERLFKDVFGDQIEKVTSKLQDIAREAVKDELTRLNHEVSELRTRLARLEEERAQHAADSLEASF